MRLSKQQAQALHLYNVLLTIGQGKWLTADEVTYHSGVAIAGRQAQATWADILLYPLRSPAQRFSTVPFGLSRTKVGQLLDDMADHSPYVRAERVHSLNLDNILARRYGRPDLELAEQAQHAQTLPLENAVYLALSAHQRPEMIDFPLPALSCLAERAREYESVAGAFRNALTHGQEVKVYTALQPPADGTGGNSRAHTPPPLAAAPLSLARKHLLVLGSSR